MLLSIILTFLAFIFITVSSSDTQTCLNLGFNKESLQCQSCAAIQRVIGDEELFEDCLSCCMSVDKELYDFAVLEIDKRSLAYYPNLGAIIKVIESDKPKKKVKTFNC